MKSFSRLVVTLPLVLVACSHAAPNDADSSAADIVGTGPAGTTAAAGSSFDCPVLVVGGGTGGIAAAIAAARAGIQTCVTEETDWVGGQLTAQGLNASDDSRYTDTIGSTRTFRELRSRIRGAYGGKANPGGCWVSYLCAEPKVALDGLAAMTQPFVTSGMLRVFYNLKVARVTTDSGRVTGAVLARTDGGEVTFHAQQTIDATELGDVIKLSGAGYRAGQEARSDTGEADAPEAACPDCVQAFTYDIALERRPNGENNVIPKSDGYGVKPWMRGFTHKELPNKQFFDANSEWTYRRIVDGAALGRTDISIMNWSSQATNDPNTPFEGGSDYPFANILDKSDTEVAEQLQRARERALAYVYWLQTEADGHGYPSLKLRSDVLGTDTGVAKYPYIREGRRLRALQTIKVEDVSTFYNPGSARARTYDIPVAIGFYPLDMHTNSGNGGTGYPRGSSLPYQVPMGALIPETMNGLLAGAKNIGTTHMTNAAYRLHPIEWAIGEAAGTLAAYSVSWKIEPRDAFANEGHARELEDRLLSDGAPLYWIDDVDPQSPNWRDVQLVAAAGIMGGDDAGSLHFNGQATLTRAQAAVALVRMLGLTTGDATGKFADVPKTHWAAPAIELLASKGIVSGTGDGDFSPDDPVTNEQMKTLLARSLDDAIATRAVPNASASNMSRLDCAVALAHTYRARLYLP
jgi:hypothetical protein